MEQQTRVEFKQEWLLLQAQCEQSERCALFIKLVCLMLTATLIALATSKVLIASFVLIFWLQEAIWKTFQSRTEARLITIESMLNNASEATTNKTNQPFQFNLAFQANRPSGSNLILSYLKQALRPTIAYPYLVLIAVIICFS